MWAAKPFYLSVLVDVCHGRGPVPHRLSHTWRRLWKARFRRETGQIYEDGPAAFSKHPRKLPQRKTRPHDLVVVCSESLCVGSSGSVRLRGFDPHPTTLGKRFSFRTLSVNREK